MTRKYIISAIALLLLCTGARAQFYDTGTERASLRWYRMETDNYRLIYPAGMDSLARVYGLELEQWRGPVGQSIGFVPNQSYRRKMPVVLHAYRAVSNGLVAWTPRRMELHTVPDAYSPDAMYWEKELAVHESRHVSQMQFGRYGGFKALHWLVGELSTGALSAIYPGPAFLEGDAVTAETALTNMGRGRRADFLEDIRYAFDNGDRRNWYQWRYGSIKKNYPDYYRVGYMTIAGMRTVYDEPRFSERYYVRIFDRSFGYPFFNMRKTIKDVSGKSFKDSWNEIGDAFQSNWEANMAARGPFQSLTQITEPPRYYTEYTGVTTDGQDIYAVESGLRTARNLVRISPDGQVERMRPFASITSDLMWSDADGMLYWSETRQDRRWTLEEYSDICRLDPDDGKIRFLTTGGRYFNPSPSPDGSRIAATEYPVAGGSAIVILDSASGAVLERFKAPDGVQFVESAWTSLSGNAYDLIASGIGREGFSIYDPQSLSVILGPTPQHIHQLRGHGDSLSFISDIDGASEVYVLDAGGVHKSTATRYGVSDHIINGDKIYVSALTEGGRMLFSAPFSKGDTIDFNDFYKDPIAEELSAQERELAAMHKDNGEVKFAYREPSEVHFSEPVRFRRLPNLIRIHSWAPLYVNYNKVQSLSFDQLYMTAAPGATIFFQNDLGFSGFAGVSYHKDAYDEEGSRRTSFHADMSYTGLYPVLEASIDVGDRNLFQYYTLRSGNEVLSVTSFAKSSLGAPSVSGNLKAYVPLRFSSGGWSRGLIPQLQWGFGNDRFKTGVVNIHNETTLDGSALVRVFDGYEDGSNLMMQRVVASVRGYSMLGTPTGGIYPRLGIGAEVGYSARTGLGSIFTPNFYTYAYGYVPGFVQGHSTRLTAMYQRQLQGAMRQEAYLNTVPRGFSGSGGVMEYIQNAFPSQTKLTAEYAFATLPMDWAGLGDLAYVRNLEVSLIGDLGFYGSKAPKLSDSLYSVGGSLALHLCNLLWIPYDTHLGFTYTYNGGSLLQDMTTAGTKYSRHYVGLIFGIDM